MGRRIGEQELQAIRALIQAHPQAHRRRLSQLLCEAWGWKNEQGQYKDMAARNLMLQLQERAEITLPAPRRPPTNAQRGLRPGAPPGPRPALECGLSSLQPIILELILPGGEQRALFQGLLAHYHYLGYRGPVGENLQYLAWSVTAEPLACLVFEAAAWKGAVRDQFLGWSSAARQARLRWMTNHSRLLILPWVRVPHLASHLLALATARLRPRAPAARGRQDSACGRQTENQFTKGPAEALCLGLSVARGRDPSLPAVEATPAALYLY